MLGRITVTGIRFHAYHGLTKLERKVGVRYRVDVAVLADIDRAAKSDRISDTIDYREVHDLVVSIGRKNSFHLIERLATRIAAEILDTMRCESVEVDVKKETPVVDGIVDSVGVSVVVERKDAKR
ncbi:MAG: dihydroneopterin aldolase [Acidobacteriota bacterium]|nr:dihydroneopterin aldolase [Acidobacteriota bacterium]